VALLGAIALIVLKVIGPAAARSVHLPTILLLFSFMVISAQLRLGGFYPWVAFRMARLPLSPGGLLAATIPAAGCRRRGLNPVPYLLALACAANVGSAATLVGNPQNMLIGSALRLSFARYAAFTFTPVLLGLGAVWAIIARRFRRRWILPADASMVESSDETVNLDHWQAAKGLATAGALLVIFLATGWPRDVAALAAAGLLLMSRRLHSRKMLGLVDWELLVLFTGSSS
jgi:Na+/H+ antiporter NhaD/arsenite permease-like protein